MNNRWKKEERRRRRKEERMDENVGKEEGGRNVG